MVASSKSQLRELRDLYHRSTPATPFRGAELADQDVRSAVREAVLVVVALDLVELVSRNDGLSTMLAGVDRRGSGALGHRGSHGFSCRLSTSTTPPVDCLHHTGLDDDILQQQLPILRREALDLHLPVGELLLLLQQVLRDPDAEPGLSP